MIFVPRAGFRYPIEPAPRTAVLVGWFRRPRFRQGSWRVFPSGWCREAASFSPGAIAATLGQLSSLAEAHPPALTHALIALARPDDPMVSLDDRERLWDAFRVPLFEQVIGPRGELLAAECEAHAGLHIEAQGFAWAAAQIETQPCACGLATPRLAPAKPADVGRSVAAYAR